MQIKMFHKNIFHFYAKNKNKSTSKAGKMFYLILGFRKIHNSSLQPMHEPVNSQVMSC